MVISHGHFSSPGFGLKRWRVLPSGRGRRLTVVLFHYDDADADADDLFKLVSGATEAAEL